MMRCLKARACLEKSVLLLAAVGAGPTGPASNSVYYSDGMMFNTGIKMLEPKRLERPSMFSRSDELI